MSLFQIPETPDSKAALANINKSGNDEAYGLGSNTDDIHDIPCSKNNEDDDGTHIRSCTEVKYFIVSLCVKFVQL